MGISNNPQNFGQLHQQFTTGEHKDVGDNKNIRWDDSRRFDNKLNEIPARGVYTHKSMFTHDFSKGSYARRQEKYESGAQHVKTLLANEVGKERADIIFKKVSDQIGKDLNKGVQVKHLDLINEERLAYLDARQAYEPTLEAAKEASGQSGWKGGMPFFRENIQTFLKPAFLDHPEVKNNNATNYSQMMMTAIIENAMDAGELTREDIQNMNVALKLHAGEWGTPNEIPMDLAGPLSSGDNDNTDVTDRKSELAQRFYDEFGNRSKTRDTWNISSSLWNNIDSQVKTQTGQEKLDTVLNGYYKNNISFTGYALATAMEAVFEAEYTAS